MDTKHPSRLLSIGEFSAATQLSPKALRLYDDQGLLRPASVDATTGYRHYRTDQVPLGRLIRTLREMDLPLTGIADIVSADRARAEALMIQLADTGELGQSPQAPGLLAISLGLCANVADDILLLEQAMPLYDALYSWCKTARDETHSWPKKVA